MRNIRTPCASPTSGSRGALGATRPCLCGCQPDRTGDWDHVQAVMADSAPHFDVVDGCTGKSSTCADPTWPCILDDPQVFRPALDALEEWDRAHRDRSSLRVVTWNDLRLPRTVAAQASENGFQAATMARFEITFGPLFGHHPERLQQQFWITDEAVIIATEIHGQPRTVHAIVPVTYHHDTPNSTGQNGPTP